MDICIYVATGNAHKVLEIRRYFETHGLNHVTVCSAKELGGMPEVKEDAGSFEGNAAIKARALREKAPAGTFVLADDSGICVDALNGAPGIFSARYAGEGANDRDNNAKLMKELAHIPDEQRTAYYVCSLAAIGPSGEEFFFTAKCNGYLIHEPHGSNGFGYDPYFIPDGYNQTFGDLSPDIKDRISHRAKALSLLIMFFKSETAFPKENRL